VSAGLGEHGGAFLPDNRRPPLEEAEIANEDAVKISRCCSVIGKRRRVHHGSPIPRP